MKTLVVYIIICITSLILTACGGGGGSTAPAALQPSNPAQAPTVQQVTLPYYSKSTVFTPTLFSGGVLHTYPAITEIANCAVYNSNTYCWDNGVIQTVTGDGTVPILYHTYWGLAMNGAVLTGGAVQQYQNDALQNPRIMSATLVATVGQPAINAVLAGTQSQASCTLASGVLNCVTFTVDTNQVPL